MLYRRNLKYPKQGKTTIKVINSQVSIPDSDFFFKFNWVNHLHLFVLLSDTKANPAGVLIWYTETKSKYNSSATSLHSSTINNHSKFVELSFNPYKQTTPAACLKCRCEIFSFGKLTGEWYSRIGTQFGVACPQKVLGVAGIRI